MKTVCSGDSQLGQGLKSGITDDVVQLQQRGFSPLMREKKTGIPKSNKPMKKIPMKTSDRRKKN